MTIDSSVFRAYDIRGIRDTQITSEFMKNLGRAFAAVFQASEVVVGYDARPSSKEFLPYFMEGITEQGADVRLVGLVPSELVIVTAGLEKIKNAAIITASHNPAEYIGIKLFKETSIQIAYDDGQADMKAMMEQDSFPEPTRKGEVKEFDPWPGYVNFVKEILNLPPLDKRRVLVDAGNGTGGMIINHLAEVFNFDVTPMYFEPDGTYPNHTPNPIVPYFRHEAEERAQKEKYDLTILFDGDADRVVFLDEMGHVVPTDFTGTLIVDEVMQKKYPKSPAATDLKRGWTLKLSGQKHGYETVLTRTGNPFLKRVMREKGVPFGFEGSAHNIYRDYFFSESSALTIGYIVSLLQTTGKPMSELVAPYAQQVVMIEETNYEHHDVKAAFKAIEDHFADGHFDRTDGVSIEYPDWHANLRTSNTEPLIRLNLEAKNLATLQEKFTEMNDLITQTGGHKVEH